MKQSQLHSVQIRECDGVGENVGPEAAREIVVFVLCSPPPPTTASEEPHSARTNHEAAPKCTTTTKYRPDVTWQRSPFVAGAHDSRRCRLESPHE